MIRVPYDDLFGVLNDILLKTGFETDRAKLCARLFADTSRDGVYSHGLDRFPRFMEMIKRKIIDINGIPVLRKSLGALEQWDGAGGPGNLNAYSSMNRALEISREHGIGCVALSNTNHWMRGGTYGWQAADAGMIGICWTNTMPNLPPWGSREPRLGNNPLVFAVPRNAGHVVLDMAMSQFSYGSLESYRLRNERLPVAGGYDLEGELTREPSAIEASGRPLPIGYWKGSGLALMLDVVAVLLSSGLGTHQIARDSLRETGLSQVFIAINSPTVEKDKLVNEIVEFVRSADPVKDSKVRYPGERTLETRRHNLAQGIPINEEVWKCVLLMKNT